MAKPKLFPQSPHRNRTRARWTGEYLLKLAPNLQTRLFTFAVSRLFGSRGKGTVVCPPFRYANLRYVHLGDSVYISGDCWVHVQSPRDERGIPRLVIGDYSTLGMGVTISVAHEVVLGRYVMLSRNVYISDHRHAYEDVRLPINEQGIADIRSTSIGDEAWLGHNVCVLPGVHIGRHCVIGANSTVTRDIPDYCVAVGSPARVVKVYDFREKRWLSCAHRSDEADGERVNLCGNSPRLI